MLGVILYVFSIFVLTELDGTNAACLGVPMCNCEANPNGLIINCRSQGLNRVPAFTEISDTLYYELTLDNNNVNAIDDNAFNGMRVKRLILTNNKLSRISDKAFLGLEADLVHLALQLDQSISFPTVPLSKLLMLESLEIDDYGQNSLPSEALTSLSRLKTLTMTSGALRVLTPADLSSQRTRLSTLNLESNLFTEIPSSALASLVDLNELQLDLNQIRTIGSSAFEGVSNLKILDISRNPIGTVEPDAFVSLGNSLRNLSLQLCHLSNEHLRAITQLKSLAYLDISDNLLTQSDDILSNMKNLEVLKASRNRLTTLRRASYNSMSNSLKVLQLDDNPLQDVASDTFMDLTVLQELYLDGAQTLRLDSTSFVSQKTSLQLLSVRSVNFANPPWPAISELSVVRTLWMSSCGLTDVPDYTFSRMSRLENLDLNNNAISRLTQRSLSGLSNSLIRLYLSGNKLETLDECVFYKFNKLDLLQLQLTNNPLRCDCGLKWLHDKLQPYKKNPDTNFRVTSLQWRCANLNGKTFVTLTDSDFQNCTNVTPAIQCEDTDNVTPSTGTQSTPSPTPPGAFALQLTEVTHDSILVTWTVPVSDSALGFTLTYVVDGKVSSVPNLPPDTNKYQLKGLSPLTQYIVCIEMSRSSAPTSMTTCSNATTSGIPPPNMLPVILGASVAGGCVLLVLLVTGIIICIRRSRPNEPLLIRQPTVGRQSKRYRKTMDGDTTLNTTLTRKPREYDTRHTLATDNMSNMSADPLVRTLEKMTDEEKGKLVSLLTTSMNSLDDLDQRYTGARYGVMDPAGQRSGFVRDRHEYYEIPDSYYDEIKPEEEEQEQEGGVEGETEPKGDKTGLKRSSH